MKNQDNQKELIIPFKINEHLDINTRIGAI
jgi:hypothetical protein